MAEGDFSALDAMIASCRAVKGLAKDAAPEAAKRVEASLRATATAGQTPDGVAWAPKKRGGGRAMVNAAAAITVKAVGGAVLIVLRGVEVFHHFGAAGKPARPVIPQGRMPKRLGDAIRLGFVQPWREKVARR